MSDVVAIRSWLYAPGNNVKLLQRVFTAGADAVILDLEDAVPPAEKERARAMVAEAVASRAGRARPSTFVRVNAPDGDRVEADVRAVVRPGLAGLRVPKCERAQVAARVARTVDEAERAAGMPNGAVRLVCGIETAAGVEASLAIASASERVDALAFGAADFVADVGASVGEAQLETLYARSRLVIASRVAGIRPPVDSVHGRVDDLEGLERTTRRGKALGFFGRACIHPRQVTVVNNVYTPTADELARARAIVDAARDAERSGTGALGLPDGTFVDVAIVRRAELVLRVADALRTEASR
ncbi:MAG: CoA ester lyase [Chloroflexota bacterium]|nr:CoA ester lyase [Chloroflexota bacterium]